MVASVFQSFFPYSEHPVAAVPATNALFTSHVLSNPTTKQRSEEQAGEHAESTASHWLLFRLLIRCGGMSLRWCCRISAKNLCQQAVFVAMTLIRVSQGEICEEERCVSIAGLKHVSSLPCMLFCTAI